MISTLAEGIDPTTGELLPEANVINKVEIVQALCTALNYLDEKETKMNVPENSGKPWTKEDEKFYPTMLWVVSNVINSYDEFKYGWCADGNLIRWDFVSPSR